MMRRTFLRALAGVGAAVVGTKSMAAPEARVTPADIEDMRKNWRALLRPDVKVPAPDDGFARNKDEWKKLHSGLEYDVLREEGTERPFSSPLNNEKRAGVFACKGCGLPLFTSRMKFDSGTGWPSFITSIPGALATKRDTSLMMVRTEYHCIRCGSHHGHLFDDGPPPTHERWCSNGIALSFIPARLA
jgi:peptide-methionine (R)-S-oxide reductase